MIFTTMVRINERHLLDVAQIFREYGEQFLSTHKICADQYKAYRDISQCRTSAMGGHVDRCGRCSHQRIAYNSCRNRHCNKCQYLKQQIWVDKLQGNLPVCRYFHMVFTLPSALHKLFYLNQRLCYDLLFKATAQTLQKVGANPGFIGAETGAVSVLHTWGQALTYHPHIHMLIPAGGLSSDGNEWIKADKNFFLPVKALSKVFRGVLWNKLDEKLTRDKVRLPDDWAGILSLKRVLYAKNWNVYAKKSLAGPHSVVKYLGKYTHRVAISNNRIVDISNHKISFRWKNYRKGMAMGLLNLDANEFIARFLRHILPSGFYKIRYYGLLAATNGDKKKQCFHLIGKALYTSLLQGINAKQVLTILTGKDPDQCPKCRMGKMGRRLILDPE